MIALVLSLTAERVLSLTGESSYRQPESGLTNWLCAKIWLLNYANTESFGFFLTPKRLADSVDGSGRFTVAPLQPSRRLIHATGPRRLP